MIDEAIITLADLCDLIAVQVAPRERADDEIYVGLEHVYPGRFVRLGEGKAADVESSKYTFQPGDVLYGKLRPYLDKAVLVRDRGICTTELLVLRPKEGIDPRFLVSVIHAPSFVAHAVSGTTGVQHPRTSWHHISEFEIPAFAADEQSQIADLLWQIHDAISANEAIIAAGADLKRAAMNAVFTRGITHEAQKETEIGPVPESWAVADLGSLGRIGNGSTPRKAVTEYWKGGTFPWLTSAKVYDRQIVEAEQFVTDVALAECHLPRVQPGAVLVAITGQGKTLGHCAVLSIEATINQHLAYISVDPKKANPFFIRGYLETKYSYLRQVGAGGGSTKGALTCAFLRQLKVPLPSLDEQEKIVTIFDSVDRKVDLHRRKLEVLEDLSKTLLNKVITGELTISDLDLSTLEAKPAVKAAA
jgi:type I restriction enzyme S subunit